MYRIEEYGATEKRMFAKGFFASKLRSRNGIFFPCWSQSRINCTSQSRIQSRIQ
jgi:hypothetical protein